MANPRRPLSRLQAYGAASAGALVLFCIILFASFKNPPDRLAWGSSRSSSFQLNTDAPWLLATMSPAYGFGRRHIIRNTWQRMYADASRFDTRFVISNATDVWLPLVQAENDTYGDIVMLSHLPETWKVANTIKPVEFLKAVVNDGKVRPYKFMSKMDDDTFLDATRFYDKHLQPLLDSPAGADGIRGIPPTLIGKDLYLATVADWEYPTGAFYTLTWDLAAAVVKEYERGGTQDIKGEDLLMGKLLLDSGIHFNFDKMPYREAFDFGGRTEDGLVNETQPWSPREKYMDEEFEHGIGPGSMRVHALKTDSAYARVAACFDENGVKLDDWRKNVDLNKWNKSTSLT